MVSTRFQSKRNHIEKISRSFHPNKFHSLGIYYGYPDCCTKYFVRNILCIGRFAAPIKKSPSRIQSRAGKHSGYIPCPYCAWKIVTKQTTIENLIKNRICEFPFPQQQPHRHKYIYK